MRTVALALASAILSVSISGCSSAEVESLTPQSSDTGHGSHEVSPNMPTGPEPEDWSGGKWNEDTFTIKLPKSEWAVTNDSDPSNHREIYSFQDGDKLVIVTVNENYFDSQKNDARISDLLEDFVRGYGVEELDSVEEFNGPGEQVNARTSDSEVFYQTSRTTGNALVTLMIRGVDEESTRSISDSLDLDE